MLRLMRSLLGLGTETIDWKMRNLCDALGHDTPVGLCIGNTVLSLYWDPPASIGRASTSQRILTHGTVKQTPSLPPSSPRHTGYAATSPPHHLLVLNTTKKSDSCAPWHTCKSCRFDEVCDFSTGRLLPTASAVPGTRVVSCLRMASGANELVSPTHVCVRGPGCHCC
jgi:hypothetical protein